MLLTREAKQASKDDSNSSSKVLGEDLRVSGVAQRSEPWPGSPGGANGGLGGCPENIPASRAAISEKLYILLLMDIWVDSNLGLLQIRLL